MTAIASLTGIAKRMGVARPIKRWIQANVETGFHSLSPDLLVAVVRAFEEQTDFEGRAYYEFGVFRGYSLWFAEQISRGRTPKDFQFHGFDSFQGLPETRVDARFFGRGDLTAGYNRVRDNLTRFGADWSRIQLHKGFYSDPFFSELSSRVTFDPVSIAVIDVVVYESCVPVLNFLGPGSSRAPFSCSTTSTTWAGRTSTANVARSRNTRSAPVSRRSRSSSWASNAWPSG